MVRIENLLQPEAINSVNGEIIIPVGKVSDGNLHRFILAGHPTRFIVMQVGDKTAVALDACKICGSQGYVQEGLHHLLELLCGY